jgi:hypothetical protein
MSDYAPIASLTTDWNGELVICWVKVDSHEAAVRLGKQLDNTQHNS